MSENTQIPQQNMATGTPVGRETPAPTPIVTTDFLQGTETADKEALYADLFEKNANGELVRAEAHKKSPLLIFTNVMTYLMPILLIASILGAAHALIRSQEDNSLAENFPFLCGYLNYGINTENPTYECYTPSRIEQDIKLQTEKLEKDIVEQFLTYIPIKVSSAAANSSIESSIAKEIFSKKINANNILAQFEKIKSAAQSPKLNNIFCGGMNISNENNFTVQCSIYGGDIGSSDTKQLGSSRIEAIRFMELLGNTDTSHFILTNPPTILAVESVENEKDISPSFHTKTTVTLTLSYLPDVSQI